MLATFLFWNLDKKPLADRVARLAAAHAVDLVALAECGPTPEEIVAALNAGGPGPYRYAGGESRKLRVFTRFPESALAEVFVAMFGEFVIWRLTPADRPDVLLALAHLPSKMGHDDEELAQMVTADYAGRLAESEDQFGHSRTVLVGDLNMNPWDAGVAGHLGFNAMANARLARRSDGERRFRGRMLRTFHNPMWRLLADHAVRPPGTLFTPSRRLVWYMFDQVLVRPSLADRLVGLDVLTTDGADHFVDADCRPANDTVSDHLPVLFRLDL